MSIFGDATDDILGGENLNEAMINENCNSDEEVNNENGENTSTKIEPKKRSVKNPRPRLRIENLTGPRGIHTIETYFKNIKFLGKGHERKDLNEVMQRLQHWAHRMYPNYKFDDILVNIERLGKKQDLQRHMSRYRQGLLQEDKQVEEGDLNEQCKRGDVQDEPFDEFDALLGEQIAISKLAPTTPSFHAANMSVESSVLTTPKFWNGNAISSTPQLNPLEEPEEVMAAYTPAPKLTAEQIARIAENRRLAQEKLKAKRETAATGIN